MLFCDKTQGSISVQFSCSVVYNYLPPHELHHACPYGDSQKPVSFQVVPDFGEALSHLALLRNWGEVWKLEIEAT